MLNPRSTEVLIRHSGRIENQGGVKNGTLNSTVISELNFSSMKMILMSAATDGTTDIEVGVGFPVDGTAPNTVSGPTVTNLQVSASDSIALPVASGTPTEEIVTFTPTDSLSASPVARTDGGRGFILNARWFTLAASVGGTQGTADVTAGGSVIGDIFVNGPCFSQGFNSGINSIDNPATTAGLGSSSAPVIWVLECDSAMISHAVVGDSVTAGDDSITNLSAAGRYTAETLSISGEPCSVVNFGSSGMMTVNYLANFENSLAHAVPTIASFSAWSSNNPEGTGAGQSYNETEVLARANEFLTICQTFDIIPILNTPTGQEGSSFEPERQSIAQALRDLAASETAAGRFTEVTDYDLLVMDQTATANTIWKPAFKAAGPNHPNQAGQELISGDITNGQVAAIRRILDFYALAPILTTPYSIGANNGPMFTITTSNTIATIEAAGFFNDNAGYASLLKTNDVLLIQASNNTKMYTVTVNKELRIITLSTGIVIV